MNAETRPLKEGRLKRLARGCLDASRLLLAGCFVWAGVMVIIAALGSIGVLESKSNRFSPIVIGLTICVVMISLTVLAIFLFNKRGVHPLGFKSKQEYIAELEKENLLVDVDYKATRAFEVEEFEDEGMHYYIELADGTVLFLGGQYLYEYQEIKDDEELNQPRRFPCTEFTIRRHRNSGYVADIRCMGIVIEPEAVMPPFEESDWLSNRIPEDGLIISDRTYDDLKSGRVAKEIFHP